MKEKKMSGKFLDIFMKSIMLIGIVMAFCKLPGIIAEKISYWKMKNKK